MLTRKPRVAEDTVEVNSVAVALLEDLLGTEAALVAVEDEVAAMVLQTTW